MKPSKEISRSNRIFARLLTLLPVEFRDRFGGEMRAQFKAELASGRSPLRLWAHTTLDIAAAAPREHWDRLDMDLRFALRTLSKLPLYSLTAIISLAVGIGATATVVSVFQAAFQRGIPGVRSEGLVNVKPRLAQSETADLISYPDFTLLREQNRTLEGLAGFHGSRLSWSTKGEAEVVPAQLVSADYFSVLGVKPMRGRFFATDEEHTQSAVAIVSSWFWRHRLGGDQAVLGHRLILNGTSFTIVGVAEDGFRGNFIGFNFDIFLPTSMSPLFGLGPPEDRDSRWIELVGKLGEDSDTAATQSDFDLLAGVLAREAPSQNEGLTIEIEANHGIDADFRGGLLVFLTGLFLVSALVLLIACVNVANMMLSQMVRRQREMAVRQALGAPRSRLIRQLVTEGLLLAGAATAVGALLAFLSLRLLEARLPILTPGIGLDLALDSTTMLAAILIAFASTLLFAGAPARSFGRRDLVDQLGGRAEVAAASRFRQGLIVAQIALSLVILITGGMFLRTLSRVASIDPGFELEGIYVAGLRPQLMALDDNATVTFFDAVRTQASATPGLDSVGLTSRLPLSLGARLFPNPLTVSIAGHEPPANTTGFAIEHAAISPGYLETMGIAVLRGRAFNSKDRQDTEFVALVNQAFVDRFFVDRPVLGTVLKQNDRALRITGVVEDSRYRKLEEDRQPFLYLALSQSDTQSAALVAKATPNIVSPVETLRSVIREVEPHLPVTAVSPLRRSLDVAFLPQRIGSGVAGALGLVGLFLSAVGIYGVVAYSVNRRSAEIGIRVSLGAQPHQVLSLVIREGLTYSLLGTLLAMPIAFLITDLLRVFLVGSNRFDTIVYVGMSLLVVATSLAASCVPARKAMRIDPLDALRQL